MDETVYKRSRTGKKLRKPEGETRKLVFNNQTVTMTRTVRIGRAKSNDIVLPDSLVSREHAVIELKNGRYTITDLESKNCTYVNSDPLRENEKRKLGRGDKIKIGNTVFDII